MLDGVIDSESNLTIYYLPIEFTYQLFITNDDNLFFLLSLLL